MKLTYGCTVESCFGSGDCSECPFALTYICKAESCVNRFGYCDECPYWESINNDGESR